MNGVLIKHLYLFQRAGFNMTMYRQDDEKYFIFIYFIGFYDNVVVLNKYTLQNEQIIFVLNTTKDTVYVCLNHKNRHLESCRLKKKYFDWILQIKISFNSSNV